MLFTRMDTPKLGARWDTGTELNIDVESQSQGILADIVHGCSGVTYPYLMKEDFFSLIIQHENSLRPAILLLVCKAVFRFFAFFPRVSRDNSRPSSLPARVEGRLFSQAILRVMRASVRSLYILCKLIDQCSCPEFLAASRRYELKVKLACSVGKQNF